MTTYPYRATKEREAAIRDSWQRVKPSMTTAEVVAILGEPDDQSPIYEPQVWRPKERGVAYWYIVQRLCESGSANDKQEKLVRVWFDPTARVHRVDAWGL